MKKIITTILFVLCTIGFTGITANATTDTLMSDVVEDGRVFLMSDEEPILFEGEISSFVREVRTTYKRAEYLKTHTEVYIADSVEQIKHMMLDSEVVEVQYSNSAPGLKLFTNKNGEDIVYIFNSISWNHECDEKTAIWSFPYENFMYTVFVKDNQLKITKKWCPVEGAETHNLIFNPEAVESLKNDLDTAENVHFSTEVDFYPRLHAYIYRNDGSEVDYTMFFYNEKPFNVDTSQIIGKVYSDDDEITLYVEDGYVCADSAVRSSRQDANR